MSLKSFSLDHDWEVEVTDEYFKPSNALEI